jgi:uncharacterized protein
MTDPFAGVTPRTPAPEGPNAEFYARAATGRVHIQRCADCGHLQHPPRYRCRACASANLDWQPVDGTGTLYSWTTSHFPFDRGWAPALPYSTGVIELPGEVRIVAALAAEIVPQTGLPVRIEPVPRPDGSVLLCIRPADREHR